MNLFFDSIIVLYLIASLTFATATFRDRKIPGKWEYRHPRITLTVFVLLCLSAILMFWGSFIEPRLITVNRVSIDLPNFEPTEPVRAALISDVHVGTYKKGGWVRRVSKRIAQEKPDLVLIAGDLIVSRPEHAKYLSSLSILTSSFRTYAVLGDHDYHVNRPHYKLDEKLAKGVGDALAEAGVFVLSNDLAVIKLKDAWLQIIGLDDWLAGKTDFEKPFARSEDAMPRVVLIHNPDFILAPESKNADLILAGNTHGGQIRLPFIGPVPRLPSKLPREFDEGLFELNSHPSLLPPPLSPPRAGGEIPSGRGGKPVSPPLGGGDSEGVQSRRLFITSGISESGPRARLFNPPEIVILSLH